MLLALILVVLTSVRCCCGDGGASGPQPASFAAVFLVNGAGPNMLRVHGESKKQACLEFTNFREDHLETKKGRIQSYVSSSFLLLFVGF